MALKMIGRIRVGVLVLIGLSALAGIFPGILFSILRRDPADVDRGDFIMVGTIYAVTFALVFVWLILVALERRLRAGGGKTLEDS